MQVKPCSQTITFLIRNLLASIALIFLSIGAFAHEVRPAIVDFKLVSEDKFEFEIKTNVEAIIARIGAEHSDTDESPNAEKYDALRAMAPEKLKSEFESYSPEFLKKIGVFFGDKPASDLSVNFIGSPVGDLDLARDSKLVVSGKVPQGAKSFTWKWPAEYGPNVIRTTDATAENGEGYSAYLDEGALSEEIPFSNAKNSFWGTVYDYVIIGFEHIIPKGLDHILFVVGLFLLSVKLRPLIWQVTAFTLAHTVTLALGILGIVTISPAIVEPLIAASIAYVAIENLMTDKLTKWRPAIIFAFGLLHGLGFAGVLGEIGLPQGQFIASLIAFNVGVEIGQLAVIAACFLLVGFWFGNKPWYRKFITIPISFIIAAIALWWVYERIFL